MILTGFIIESQKCILEMVLVGSIRSDLYVLAEGQAQPMTEYSYVKEDDLQKIIADNPHLLLRKSSGEDEVLMLVGREFAVSESSDISNSYFLDALFLNQSGVPVLVEVKRSSDTRIRREVVGQMLDYASRAKYWDIESIQKGFRSHISQKQSEQFDTDDFWQRVTSNLRAENVQLVFVADTIPDSLKTIIEFLGRNMPTIEVYGVEIKQYNTSRFTMLSSTFIDGALPNPKPSAKSIEWTAASFSQYLLDRGMEKAAVATDIFRKYADNLGLSCNYGRGAKYPSLSVRTGNTRLFSISPWEYAAGLKCPISFCIPELLPLLDADWTETKLRKILTCIPGRDAGYDSKLIWDTPQYVYMDMSILADPENMEPFISAIQTICEAVSTHVGYHA